LEQTFLTSLVTNISNIIGNQANARAQQQAALYGGIGQGVSQLDLSGLFSRFGGGGGGMPGGTLPQYTSIGPAAGFTTAPSTGGGTFF